jgi:hypothetical protein
MMENWRSGVEVLTEHASRFQDDRDAFSIDEIDGKLLNLIIPPKTVPRSMMSSKDVPWSVVAKPWHDVILAD